MTRRHNFFDTVVRVLAIALLFGLLAPTAGAATNPSLAAGFYEKAIAAYERGDYRSALIHLRNARQRAPDDLPSRILLGRTYLKLGEGAAAASELREALRGGADEALALEPFAEALLMQRDYAAIEKEIPLGGHPPPLESKLLVVRARALMAQRRLDEARSLVEEAARLAPDDAGPLLAQAALHLAEGRADLAEDLADLSTDMAPDNADGWLLKAELRRKKGDLRAALAAMNEALNADPQLLTARTGRAAVLLDLGDLERAEQDLKVVLDSRPNDPQANYLYALVMARGNRTEEADAAMRRAALALSSLGREYIANDPASLLLSGIINFNRGAYGTAYDDLQRYVNLDPGHAGARKLLGSLMLRQGDWRSAIEVLEPASRIAPNDPEILALLASGLMKAKKFSAATELLQRASTLSPDATEIHTQLALSRLAIGKRDEAIDILRTVATRPEGGAKAGFLIGFIYLNQRQFPQALAAAEELIAREPDNPTGQNLAGSALYGMGDLAGARKRFEQALVIDPTNESARYNLAKVALSEERPAEAEKLYLAILNDDPRQTRAMTELSRIMQQQGRTDEAIQWLEKLRATDSNAVLEHTRLVELYLATNRPKEALRVAQDLATSHPENLPVLLALGRSLIAMREPLRATSVFRTMSRYAGFEPGLLLQIANYQLAVKDTEGARFSLKKAIDNAPDLVAAQVAMVSLDAREGYYDEARKRAEALRAKHPERNVGYALIGDLLMQSRDYAEAVKAFEAGFSVEPSSALAVRLYRARRAAAVDVPAERAAAIAELERWVQAHPDDRDARRALGGGYLQDERLEEARALHEALLAEDANDSAVLNNLAIIYHRSGDPRAIEMAEKAHEISPNEPAVLDTLGWLLVSGDDTARGLQFLRAAQARASQEPSVRYHLAVALNKLGRAEEARRELKRAFAIGRRFEGDSEARALLDQLGD